MSGRLLSSLERMPSETWVIFQTKLLNQYEKPHVVRLLNEQIPSERLVEILRISKFSESLSSSYTGDDKFGVGVDRTFGRFVGIDWEAMRGGLLDESKQWTV